MKVEYDQAKSEKNEQDRDLPFNLAVKFEWDSALIWEDNRHDYGEIRYCSLGYIGKRLCHMVFTSRDESIRVISLRKANRREMIKYAET